MKELGETFSNFGSATFSLAKASSPSTVNSNII